MSVCLSAWNNSAPITDFNDILYLSIFQNSVVKIQVSLKLDKNNWYFSWRPIYIFLHLPQFFLDWKMFQIEAVEKIKTHFMNNNCFSKIVPFYEIMWKNTVEPRRPQMTMWRMYIACWIPKATNTHSHYVILINFPLQQWLHEHTSMLHWFYEFMKYHCGLSWFLLGWSQIWSGPHHTERHYVT